jgi:exopolysaccharide production protein ExoQ
MSVSWSDYQGVSFRRWIRASGDLLMVLIILTEEDQDKALEHLLRRIAIILVPLSILSVRWFRNYGILYTPHGAPHWAGVTTGKNELGLLCAYLGVFLAWRLLKMWPKPSVWDISLFIMLLYLLWGARSSTSDVVLIMGILILVGQRTVKGHPRRVNRLIVASIIILLLAQWVALNFLGESLTPLFFRATARDPTFTGRSELWRQLVSMGLQHPVLGAGYGSFWLSHMTQLWTQFDWGPVNGHNGYLDVFLDLGFVGLSMLLLLIGQTYKKLSSTIGERRQIWPLLIAYFVMFLAHNVTETHALKPTNFLWFLFLTLAITVKKKPGTSEQPLAQASDKGF